MRYNVNYTKQLEHFLLPNMDNKTYIPQCAIKIKLECIYCTWHKAHIFIQSQ